MLVLTAIIYVCRDVHSRVVVGHETVFKSRIFFKFWLDPVFVSFGYIDVKLEGEIIQCKQKYYQDFVSFHKLTSVQINHKGNTWHHGEENNNNYNKNPTYMKITSWSVPSNPLDTH